MRSRKKPGEGQQATCCGEVIGLEHELHKKRTGRPRPPLQSEEELQADVTIFFDDVGL